MLDNTGVMVRVCVGGGRGKGTLPAVDALALREEGRSLRLLIVTITTKATWYKATTLLSHLGMDSRCP